MHELRLECLKLAAEVARDPEEVLRLARQFIEFVCASGNP